MKNIFQILTAMALIFISCVCASDEIGYPGGIPIEDGAVQVVVSDQSSESVDFYFCDHSASTTLSSPVSIGDDSVSVSSASGAILYGTIGISEDGHAFQTIVSAINGSTISIGSPSDYNFSTSAVVYFGNWNMNVDGSVSDVVYYIGPPPGATWDIYTLSISMEDNIMMYESTFAGIPELTNGIAARLIDGISKQLFLVNNNAGFREYGFITDYPAKVPTGTYAFGARKNYPDTNGVSLRLYGDSGDRIEFPIRDDLTDITKLAVTAHGHHVITENNLVSTSVMVSKNTWVKVVDNQTLGHVFINDNYLAGESVFVVFLDAGDSAPSLLPSEYGSNAILVESTYLPYSSPSGIDVYLYSYKYDISAVVTSF